MLKKNKSGDQNFSPKEKSLTGREFHWKIGSRADLARVKKYLMDKTGFVKLPEDLLKK